MGLLARLGIERVEIRQAGEHLTAGLATAGESFTAKQRADIEEQVARVTERPT